MKPSSAWLPHAFRLGVLVAVSPDDDSVQVVARKRIVVVNSEMPGGNQSHRYTAELLIFREGIDGLRKVDRYY